MDNQTLRNPVRRNPVIADPARVDRLPPHSMEAEKGVLGCVLLEPAATLPEVVERLGEAGEAFYDLRHRTIYEALVSMWSFRVPIDMISLQAQLRDNKQLDAVGGLAYLSSLPDEVPSAANLSYYLSIIEEKHDCRKLITVCTKAVGKAYEDEAEIARHIDETEHDILRISEQRADTKSPGIKELVRTAIATIEELHQKKGAITGLATGFIDLDKMTNGLHPGHMIVIAARPSMGKTSLAMNIAENVAVNLKQPVGVFSLEMTSADLVLRMLCARAKVNLRSIRDGFMSQGDVIRLTNASGNMAGSPLFIDDTAGLSILQLRAKARRMHQQHGIKLFVVDYLQLLHSTSRRADNRQQEITDISCGCKALAKELNVPVIVLSQLNRDLEKDKKRKPRLSDLRESGSIEQDADLVGLLYKPTDEDDDPQQVYDAVPVNLLIAKQRNGPTGEVSLTFLKPYTRFENAAKITP